jgi:protein-disulfide isomerase
MHVKLNQIIGLVAAGSIFAGAGDAFAADMSAAQKKQVEGVVRDYLVQNPEVIVESLQSWQQKQMAQSIQKTQDIASQLASSLFHASGDPVAGNPDGKVTVVEFFDYQCPHCVDMQPVVQGLLKNNSSVRFVFKEFPIRGPLSEIAAKAALAAAQQGKYLELHNAMMDSAAKGSLTEEGIYGLAKGVGLDVQKLKTAMASDVVQQQIKANYQLAQKLQLMGTPAIFVASSTTTSKSPVLATSKSPALGIFFVPGQVNADQMNQLISRALPK